MKVLDELIVKTPEGIIEMMEIKGIGQKKFLSFGRKWRFKILANCYMRDMKTDCL